MLVDAPCTGTGTWRRNPDARLRLTEADLAELLPKQAAILDSGRPLVRTGGRLVYATCSLLSEENEAQVTAFLARHPGFALVPLARAWPLTARRRPGRFPVADPRPPRHRRVLRRGAGAARMISIRRARPSDAIAIGAVHVAAWRSAYPGILPDDFLARLSVPRQAAHYDAAIRAGTAGCSSPPPPGSDVPPAAAPRIVGFATAGRARGGEIGGAAWRRARWRRSTCWTTGASAASGGKLMRAAAAHLAETGCRSCFVWVLRDNPSRWFYQRLGGRPVAEAMIQVAGQTGAADRLRLGPDRATAGGLAAGVLSAPSPRSARPR